MVENVRCMQTENWYTHSLLEKLAMLFLKALPNLSENRHVAFCPFNALFSFSSKSRVSYVVLGSGLCCRVQGILLKLRLYQGVVQL